MGHKPRHWRTEGAGLMTERVYNVPDISCDHCVKAINQELTKIPGVQHVNVNLANKIVTVQADATVSDNQIREGIEEAGYDITS